MPDVLGSIQGLIVYLGAFVVVLSVVVFVHEFGHFQVARWRKVAIDTFSIGFSKTLLGWRDKQGVHWKIGALPLGGYVKFADDADAMSSAPREQTTDPEALAAARAQGLFHAQSLTTRSLVVAAGPLTNFVFAIFAFALFALIVGRDAPRVDEVRPDSPAAAAGLEAGDVIVAIDGAQIRDFPQLQSVVAGALGRTLALDVRRGDETFSVTITPGPHPDNPQAGALGISHASSLASNERIGPLTALMTGARDTWNVIAQTGAYIGAIFAGRESGDQIAGPLGIINISGQVANSALQAEHAPWADRLAALALSLLRLMAVLSVAVGIVNLLPIPILDGGHLLFYAVEAVRGGKPLPASAQEWAYRAGFAVLASLFLFATWNDITRLFFPGAQ